MLPRKLSCNCIGAALLLTQNRGATGCPVTGNGMHSMMMTRRAAVLAVLTASFLFTAPASARQDQPVPDPAGALVAIPTEAPVMPMLESLAAVICGGGIGVSQIQTGVYQAG